MSSKKEEILIQIPASIVKRIAELADTLEELEDWLLVSTPEFIKKMRRARKQDLEGKGMAWEKVKKELNIRSK